MSEHARIVERLQEAGLDTARFVDVIEGEKGSYDHTQHSEEEISGNYGIYANAGDRLVVLDVDDYDGLEDKSGLSALSRLPATLEQKSPHGGTHRLYAVEKTVDERYIAEVLEDELGKKNPAPTWGEVRVANQYVVGAGSQLDGCDKDWCDECATDDGGHYTLNADREIATIQPGDLVDVLQEDPNYAPDDEDGDVQEDDEFAPDVGEDADIEDILAHALQDSGDEKLQRLWRGDYSDYGGDRSSAESSLAYKLAFWLGGDRSTSRTKSLVEDAMDGRLTPPGSSDPQLEKWEERDDASYRESVLEAVDEQSEFFEPSGRNAVTPEEIDQRFDEDQPGDNTDSTGTSPDWDWLRTLYEDPDTKKNYARYAAARKLESDMEFATPRETEHLMAYNDDLGIFERGGKLDVQRALRRGLGPHYSTHEASEIVAQLKAETYVSMDVFGGGDKDAKLLCVKNGVLDLETRELHDHSPDYYFRSRLPVDYDPDAECPNIKGFMEEITAREADRKTMYEMVGNTLWPNYDHASFMVLFGEGSNGKSTFFELVEELIGSDNVSGWGLKDLEENRFATADLVDKMANIAPDLEGKKINDLGTLKALTGGDTVMAERKNEQAFEFENRAKMMFGANRPPVLGERTHAIKRRIVPIRLPYQFTSNPDDEHLDARDRNDLMEELTTEEELSGLLNKALEGLERLNDDGDFSLPETPEERLEYYEQYSDPIKEFRVTCLVENEGASVTKDAVYNAYKRFCEANNHTVGDRSVFFRQLRQTTLTYDEHRPAIEGYGERKRALKSVDFSEEGLEHVPEDMKERLGYGVQEDGEDDEDENAWNASPVADVAQDPTGYGTVTVEVLTVEHADSEDAPAWRATVKDESSAVDVVCWDDPDAPEEGDVVVIKNAELGEYQGKTQLTVRPGVTEFISIQQGVGHTEGVEPDDDQGQLDAGTQPEAEADGGQVDVKDDETSSVPDDAEGMLADARRLVDLLEQRGVPLDENEVVVAASVDSDLMAPDRAKRVLEYATTEKGLIMETDDGYVPV